MQNANLWRALGRNLLLSILMFACIFGLLWLAELIFPNITLLKWHDAAWCVGIPASVIGVAYILTIRDPQNYTGFFAGIIMSILLGIQFTLQGSFDGTFLYFFVFIPFQMMSIYKWSRKKDEGGASFEPKFLDSPRFWLSIGIGLAVTAGDYFIQTYVIHHTALGEDIAIKLCNGLMISSSFLANYWLIYRKNDSWLYWFIYSVSGIVLFILLGNIFSIVLFCFFLVINSMAGIAWIKNTKPEYYFWAAPVLGRKQG